MPEKPQRVRGFPDRLPGETARFDAILLRAAKVLKAFGFQRIDPPVVEFTKVFSRALGESSDIAAKEMYTFKKGGESLTLRPEGTASVMRLFITEKLRRETPLRFFYHGPMFRRERPQKGRFRQFYQIGAEMIGESGERADAELLSLTWTLMKTLNLHKKAALEINTIGSPAERRKYAARLKEFLRPFSGDLSAESQARLDKNPLRILDSKDSKDREILSSPPLLRDHLAPESLAKYKNTKKILFDLNIPFRENPLLVRGLDYYNDLVFEWTSPELGAQSGVLAGGRYDSLSEALGGPPAAGAGWAAGLERLAMLCGAFPKGGTDIGIVSAGEEEKAFELAHQLRGAGFSVYFRFSGNFAKQLRRAVQKNCRLALFCGKDEARKGAATIKDLDSGEQFSVPFSDLETWLAGRLAQPGGFSG